MHLKRFYVVAGHTLKYTKKILANTVMCMIVKNFLILVHKWLCPPSISSSFSEAEFSNYYCFKMETSYICRKSRKKDIVLT